MTHHLAGSACGLALAAALGWSPWQAGVSAAAATLTAGGRWSPDADQYRWWRRTDRVLPDELLGRGGPMRHRGITHWWGIPVLAALAVLLLVPAAWQWPLLALVTGWASHLAGDFVFGAACPYEHRGPGIPMAPWWRHRGMGFDSGGVLERAVVAPALVALLGWQAWALVGVAS
jgi:hypothetical protein